MRDNEYIADIKEIIEITIAEAKEIFATIKKTTRIIWVVNNRTYYDFDIKKVYDLKDKVMEIIKLKAKVFKFKQIFSSSPEIHREMNIDEYRNKQYQNLLNDKRTIEYEMNLCNRAITAITEEPFGRYIVDEVQYNISQLQRKLFEIQPLINIYEGNPDLTDDEIDIYITPDQRGIGFEGKIFLHGTQTEIGYIAYRGSGGVTWLGDISYRIHPEYRGNNFAYKALNLIQDIILSKGIDRVIITTYPDNLSSIRTIEKFGGVLIPHDDEGYLAYECHLVPKVELTDSTIKR